MVPVELDRQDGSSWKVPKVVPATEGTYSVKIVNSVGSEETSPRFHVSVRIPPTNARITNGPSLICIDRFGEVTLKVAADGDPNSFRYRWFHNEVEIKEATGPEFKISKFDGNHVGEYYAEVMNDWGLAKSGTVTLKVIGIVDMGRSLKDGKLVAYQGDLVSLAIKPTGDPPFSYRWHRQGEPISDSDRAVLEVDTRTAGTWGYRVYVNNPAKVGAVSKEVELSVHALGPGRVARLNLDLIPVPAGLFRMGSPTGEGFDDERPVREIQISRGFWMGATEITRAQWDLVFPEAGRPEKEDGRLPRSASHVEAVRFCQELTRIERAEGSLDSTLEYGLPTEAEWEYAARRAGMAPDLAAEAWFHDPQHANESSGLRPVATKQPNQAGFFDLLGNAWEWTDDVYLPYDSKAIADPLVVGSADALRVLRGGSVKMSAAGVRAGKRYSDPPETRREDYGFRIVKRRVGRVEQPIFLNQIEDQPMKGVPR